MIMCSVVKLEIAPKKKVDVRSLRCLAKHSKVYPGINQPTTRLTIKEDFDL
jgi:hypothetical protein